MQAPKSADYALSASSQPANPGGVPAAPSQLTVVAKAANEIDLQWVDNSNNETGFSIERAMANSGPFTSGAGTYSSIATTAANVTTYADKTLTGSTVYYYRVVAVNGADSSAASSEDSAMTLAAPVSSPSPPSMLVATTTAATIVTLTWADNSTNESGFKLERAPGGTTTFAQVALVSSNTTNYEDYNLNPATAYTYRLRATNSAGDSTYTAVANTTTLAAGNTATYTYVSVNVLGTNCVSCHGGATVAAGVNLSTYALTIGNLVKGNSANSKIYQVIANGSMPPGAPLTSTQSSEVKAWIDGGALNN